MPIFKNRILVIFLLLITAAGLIWISFDRIFLSVFAASHGLKISYTGLKKQDSGTYVFNGLELVDKKSRLGFSARRALIALSRKTFFSSDAAIGFKLDDMRVMRVKFGSGMRYKSLPDLVYAPFDHRWKYDKVSGNIILSADGARIKDFLASGDDIKLSLSGVVNRGGVIDFNSVIYFSRRLSTGMPEELSEVVLSEEKDGWKSLSVNLKGDFRAPAIQLSGKYFRLKINSV